jgi:ABC-type polysaccharide/polyol phosphate export permease
MLSMLLGSIVLLIAIYVVTGTLPYLTILLPIIFLLQCLFTFGLSLLVATVNVYFRDLQHLLPVGLLVWMYGTPIFYSPEMVISVKPANLWGFTITGEQLKLFLTINPLHHLITIYRGILLDGVLPLANLAWFSAFALVSLSLGATAIQRGKRGFADVL